MNNHGFYMYSGVVSIAFVIVHLLATLISRRAWRIADLLVVVWGLSYISGLWFFFALGAWVGDNASLVVPGVSGKTVAITTMIGVPGLISAALVRWAWRSNIVGAWVAAGTLGAIVAVPILDDLWYFGSPFLWNIVYAAGCVEFIRRARELRPAGICACGYDLNGLPDKALCPECGTLWSEDVRTMRR